MHPQHRSWVPLLRLKVGRRLGCPPGQKFFAQGQPGVSVTEHLFAFSSCIWHPVCRTQGPTASSSSVPVIRNLPTAWKEMWGATTLSYQYLPTSLYLAFISEQLLWPGSLLPSLQHWAHPLCWASQGDSRSESQWSYWAWRSPMPTLSGPTREFQESDSRSHWIKKARVPAFTCKNAALVLKAHPDSRPAVSFLIPEDHSYFPRRVVFLGCVDFSVPQSLPPCREFLLKVVSKVTSILPQRY